MINLCIMNYVILFNIIHFNYVKNELIFVYEHSRHGVRGPMIEKYSLFNKTTFYDEYNSHWEGDRLLTLKGKMQHYILGIRNRYKYPNLLNYTKYNSEELLIHVTKAARVRESAYSQLLGMYNPVIKILENEPQITNISESNIFYYPPNYNLWNSKTTNINKKIINEAELSIKLLEEMNDKSIEKILNLNEINSNNEKNDLNIIYTPFLENRTFFVEVNCPNYMEYTNYKYKNDFITLIKETLEKKYGNKLQNYFKYKNKEWLYNIRASFSITDHFLSNYYDGRNLDNFFNITGIDKNEYYNICFKIYIYWLFHIYCDNKTCIMESSKLMKDLIDYMDNKINNKNKINMIIDLGHDVTVEPMQIFMNKAFNINYTVCNFACNLFFELHKETKNKKDIYIVKYYVDDELKLNINYEIFKKNVLSIIWTEEERNNFCTGNIIKVLYPNLFLFLYFLLIVFLVGIFVIFLYKLVLIYHNSNLKNNKLKNNLINNKELKDADSKIKNINDVKNEKELEDIF